ncbi:MAG: ROK family transcriptional regulator, partial [Chloroflexi bacterium]|nr:ROK family transcriptional regulator [Chloroflexota bacterium]
MIRHSADHNLMRNLNRALILRHLRLASPQSRANLAARTGLMRSTVSSLVDELIESNLVHETGIGPSQGGRPGTLLELNPAGGCAVGVEITNESALVLLTDFLAHPRWEHQIRLENSAPELVIPQVEHLIEEALSYNDRTDTTRPLGIGLGTVGLVNIQTGTLKLAANLEGWRDIPFQAMWEKQFGLRVHVGNEATIA